MGTFTRRDGTEEVPFDLIVEQTILRMCRLYHCPPSALDSEDWNRGLLHLEIAQIEDEVRQAKHG